MQWCRNCLIDYQNEAKYFIETIYCSSKIFFHAIVLPKDTFQHCTCMPSLAQQQLAKKPVFEWFSSNNLYFETFKKQLEKVNFGISVKIT